MPPRMFTPPRLLMNVKRSEAVKAAQPNQRNAVEAWASWHLFSVLGEPLVTRFLVV